MPFRTAFKDPLLPSRFWRDQYLPKTPQHQVLSTVKIYLAHREKRGNETKTGDKGQERRGKGQGTKDHLWIEGRQTGLIGKWQFTKVTTVLG